MWVDVDDIQQKHGSPDRGATAQQPQQVAQALMEQQDKDGREDPYFESDACGIEVYMFVSHPTRVFISTCTVTRGNNSYNKGQGNSRYTSYNKGHHADVI